MPVSLEGYTNLTAREFQPDPKRYTPEVAKFAALREWFQMRKAINDDEGNPPLEVFQELTARVHLGDYPGIAGIFLDMAETCAAIAPFCNEQGEPNLAMRFSRDAQRYVNLANALLR